MKLYITHASGYKETNQGTYLIISEDGEILAGHYCSHIGFAFNDLTSDRKEEKRISEWKKRFGDDVDILHLHYIKDAESIENKLIEKNKQYAKDHPEHDFPKPSVSIEFENNELKEKE